MYTHRYPGDKIQTHRHQQAQARYVHLAAATICLGKTIYPTLGNLRGKFRAAKLTPQVRQWVHDNRSKILAGDYGTITDEAAESAAHLIKMVSAAVSMEI